MKICTKCKKHLPITQFAKRGDDKKKYRSHCRTCVNIANLKRYYTKDSTKEVHKTASYKHRIKSYGLTIEEYENKLSTQNNCCAICKSSLVKPNIDHCHETGIVRDILCQNCNTSLGHAKDDVNILAAMIEYIKRWREKK